MQQTEIEMAFAELVENITGTQPVESTATSASTSSAWTRSPKSTWPSQPKTVSALPYRMKTWSVSWSSATFWITSIVEQHEISQTARCTR
jgi:hypothetical protein